MPHNVGRRNFFYICFQLLLLNERKTNQIYHFYYNQPEEVVRPYPTGAGYYAGTGAVRPQLDEPGRVEEILHSMEGVLDNTADFARNYQSMQKAYEDLTDYKNGI